MEQLVPAVYKGITGCLLYTSYASFIMELLEDAKQTCSDPVVLIEQRVDFSRWVEQGFGTSDAILISDGTMRCV